MKKHIYSSLTICAITFLLWVGSLIGGFVVDKIKYDLISQTTHHESIIEANFILSDNIIYRNEFELSYIQSICKSLTIIAAKNNIKTSCTRYDDSTIKNVLSKNDIKINVLDNNFKRNNEKSETTLQNMTSQGLVEYFNFLEFIEKAHKSTEYVFFKYEFDNKFIYKYVDRTNFSDNYTTYTNFVNLNIIYTLHKLEKSLKKQDLIKKKQQQEKHNKQEFLEKII
jgi:hypothetical protein